MKNKKQNNSNAEDDSTTQRDSGIHEMNDVDKDNGNLKKFSIAKKTIKKLKARQVEYLYPVQAKSYPTIYDQKDCVIQATSGVGKTLAFALPIVELLQADDSTELEAGRGPRAVVIAPTREIIKTISDEFETLVNGLTVVSIFTAKKKSDDQETAVSNGSDILIATPDRLREFLDQSKVDVSQVKHVVIDEIDRMLDASVLEDLKKILKQVFSTETKGQLIVFSESFPDSVRKLTKKYLADDHVTISLSGDNAKNDDEEEDEDEDDDEDEEKEETVGNGSSAKGSDNVSLLTQKENHTTYMLSVTDELKSVGLVYTMLKKCFGDDFDGKAVIPKIAFSTDFKSAVFELPSEFDEQLKSYWKDSARIQMGPIDTLPDIDQDSIVDNSGYTPRSGGGGGGYGFNKSGRGGAGGNRNSGRSNACFKCQKEGHKSFECPEGGQGGGNRSGGGGGGCFKCGKEGHKSFECPDGGNKSAGGCFNCGKDGHKSFECTEPKKAGGRGGAGGERSNACFNCGQEGHRSFECTEPKKAGGRGGAGGERSNACFNCGQEGHRSFECTEPKKAGGGRGGPGGRGGRGGPGGRGGGRGGSGGFGMKRNFNGAGDNGHANGEAANKKIKFDDDDE